MSTFFEVTVEHDKTGYRQRRFFRFKDEAIEWVQKSIDAGVEYDDSVGVRYSIEEKDEKEPRHKEP